MKKKQTFDEIYNTILSILPGAQLGEDNYGQLVVYTNLYPDISTPDGVYKEFENLSKLQQTVIEER